MKKLFTLFLFAGMFAFLACGPSAEEKAAIEKAKQDSIAAVEKFKQDSIAAVEQAKQDSINAAIEQAKQDSIAAAEAAKAKKPAKKATTPKPIEKKDVKAGQGKNAK
ncbi:MAG: hypothetical protein AB9842_06390 [Bacteroidales bacterium]